MLTNINAHLAAPVTRFPQPNRPVEVVLAHLGWPDVDQLVRHRLPPQFEPVNYRAHYFAALATLYATGAPVEVWRLPVNMRTIKSLVKYGYVKVRSSIRVGYTHRVAELTPEGQLAYEVVYYRRLHDARREIAGQ